MVFVDVHAHLDIPDGVDIASVIARARQAGLVAIVANGVQNESNRKVLALAKQHALVKPALGIYPTHILEYTDAQLEEEVAVIARSRPVAIGEVGLDYKEIADEKDRQRTREWFVRFIALANSLDIPIIVHSRKAEEDVITLLEERKAKKVVMHCFSGNKKLVERIKKNGWTCSIPCSVLYAQQFQDMVLTLPISQLLTETDSPYLAPVKGEQNEPKNVILSVQKIAALKGMTPEETAKNIFMNYQRLFVA